MKPLRIIVWDGMPDRDGLKLAGDRIGRELEVSVISSNEDLEQLLENDGLFDLITPSDYLVEKLVAQGRLSPILGDGIDRNVLAGWARHPAYDPDERFSVPLAFGTTGYLYAEQKVSAHGSWKDFFEPAGVKVGLLGEVREVIGAALMLAGHSPNSTAPDDLAAAERILLKQRPSVSSVTSDDFTTPVEDGSVAMHQAWSGPAAMAVRRTPGLGYAVPEEGALLWVTTAAIPADAPDPAAAKRLLQELMVPEVAAMAVSNGGYSTPNENARGILPEELRDDEVLFPPIETIERCLTLNRISAGEEELLESVWQSIRGDQPAVP